MKFLDWYRYYQREITWWIIGWLSFAVLEDIIRDNWIMAAVNAGLIYLNYNFWKNR